MKLWEGKQPNKKGRKETLRFFWPEENISFMKQPLTSVDIVSD